MGRELAKDLVLISVALLTKESLVLLVLEQPPALPSERIQCFLFQRGGGGRVG